MAYLSSTNTAILGISSCVPAQTAHTHDYNHISPEERELFIKTTGIQERRVAADNVTCSDLCYKAAVDLLNRFKCSEDIDVLIFVSQSPDYYLPATSVLLQERLGLSKSCIAFDINLGCSGYVYGLSVISKLLGGGGLRKALLLAGDKSTSSTCFTDKSTYPLFGDAGTATLLEFTPEGKSWHFNLQSSGAGKDAIIIEHGHSRNPFKSDFEKVREISPGISRAAKHLQLQGTDIFNFALQEVAPNIKELSERSGISYTEADYAIFHQANKLINESVRKKLKIAPEKVPYSIEKYGNTSSASIPLTMCSALSTDLADRELLLLLSGFGVGFSWGSALIYTNGIYTNLFSHD
jgi:3-oxoacyl-[acyl-carrier-protein] synthase-3